MARYPKEPYATYVKEAKKRGAKELWEKDKFYKQPGLAAKWTRLKRRKKTTLGTRRTLRGLKQAGVTRKRRGELRD
jgi:hypothetical protein